MNLKVIALGALTGAWSAMRIDYAAFKTWKSLDDALHYRWDLALFRWAQGALEGGLIAGGVVATGATS